MNVYKFGGASVKDAEGFQNVAKIIESHQDSPLVVVLSAIGKTTNALESLTKSYFHQLPDVREKFEAIKAQHYQIIAKLGLEGHELMDEVNDLFVEIEWVIEEIPHDEFDYLYDQIVSVGELLSTKILAAVLRECGVAATWLDIRDVLITDEVHREAKVNWALSHDKIRHKVEEMHRDFGVIVTQGFIGVTQENHTTTLGREGSDYSAAIISYCTDAEGMHIWKDVPGVLTADPSTFDHVVKLDKLSYREAIEMTYYGAKVIHPKTIKPLQNKNIPLFVRPFGDPSSMGTQISAEGPRSYPPIIVVEGQQMLVHVSVKDFSFVAENHLSTIFQHAAHLRWKVNVMKNTAISFTICVQADLEKYSKFCNLIGEEFSITMETDLELITIRHYNQETLQEMKRQKLVLFEESMGDTVQIVVRDVPLLTRKR